MRFHGQVEAVRYERSPRDVLRLAVSAVAALLLVAAAAWAEDAILAGALVVLQLLLSVHLPVSLFAAVAVGATVGSMVLVAFGRPDQRPTVDAISAALEAVGLPTSSLRAASVDARGSPPTWPRPRTGTACSSRSWGGRALGRPPVPKLPLAAPEEPRRRAALLVAAPHRRARGLRRPARPGRRRAHAPPARGRRLQRCHPDRPEGAQGVAGRTAAHRGRPHRVEKIHLEDLQRVSYHTVFTIVLLAAVTYFLARSWPTSPGSSGRSGRPTGPGWRRWCWCRP
jgi:hypothetical protein